MSARLALIRQRVLAWTKRAWGLVREMSGDDAYDRYLAHLGHAHPDQPAMPRSAFYAERQRRKWSGVSRCC